MDYVYGPFEPLNRDGKLVLLDKEATTVIVTALGCTRWGEYAVAREHEWADFLEASGETLGEAAQVSRLLPETPCHFASLFHAGRLAEFVSDPRQLAFDRLSARIDSRVLLKSAAESGHITLQPSESNGGVSAVTAATEAGFITLQEWYYDVLIPHYLRRDDKLVAEAMAFLAAP